MAAAAAPAPEAAFRLQRLRFQLTGSVFSRVTLTDFSRERRNSWSRAFLYRDVIHSGFLMHGLVLLFSSVPEINYRFHIFCTHPLGFGVYHPRLPERQQYSHTSPTHYPIRTFSSHWPAPAFCHPNINPAHIYDVSAWDLFRATARCSLL